MWCNFKITLNFHYPPLHLLNSSYQTFVISIFPFYQHQHLLITSPQAWHYIKLPRVILLLEIDSPFPGDNQLEMGFIFSSPYFVLCFYLMEPTQVFFFCVCVQIVKSLWILMFTCPFVIREYWFLDTINHRWLLGHFCPLFHKILKPSWEECVMI